MAQTKREKVSQYSLHGARNGYDVTSNKEDKNRVGQYSLLGAGTGYDVTNYERDKNR